MNSPMTPELLELLESMALAMKRMEDRLNEIESRLDFMDDRFYRIDHRVGIDSTYTSFDTSFG